MMFMGDFWWRLVNFGGVWGHFLVVFVVLFGGVY